MDGCVFGGPELNPSLFVKSQLVSLQLAFHKVLFNLQYLFAYFSVTIKNNFRHWHK